ncbi:hypothetical protein WJX72_006433 [[Myrmecia] bisecta]|uniref:Uncharacterized protein n=1 Tax=[Myrmecia] bisecta TaxID=41462 RepID=A0AAW1QQV7_9CHLO
MDRKAAWLLLAGTFVRASVGCIIFEANGSGFAANLRYLAVAAAYYKDDGTLFIDEKWYYKCAADRGWASFFRGDLPVPITSDTPSNCRRITFTDIHAEVEQSRWNDFEKEGLARIWQLTPFMRQAVSDVLTPFLHSSQPHVAFHVRGGDKFEGGQREKMTSTLSDTLLTSFISAHPNVKAKTCLLLGDDHKLINQTQMLVENQFACRAVLRGIHTGSAHRQQQFNELSLEKRCLATQRLIIDIETMANVEYFVGSPTSGILHLLL